MEKGLFEKTGKPLEHWIEVVNRSGIGKHKAIIDFLKKEYGFTHGFANYVSLKSRKADASSMDDEVLLKNQFKGKESLVPVYEKITEFLKSLEGVELVVKKAYVSVRAKKQFAIIQASTKKRLDLGLNFPKDQSVDLEKSGSFNAMVSHRVRLETEEDFNDNVRHYLSWAHETAK